MRLDLVTNDAGELVRREHARDLGSGVVVAIYRLAKLSQMHDLQNQAFLRQLDQAHATIQDYCLRAGMNVNILFAHKAIFVAGQLMKASKAIYDMASELGEMMDWCGGAELTITRDASRDQLFSFAEQLRQGMRGERGRGLQLGTNSIRLRPVNEAARLRGLELERLPEEQKTVRMYASAVVVMRRFFDDLQESRYVLPRRIKRIAQSLVDLSDGANVAFLGVTEARNANHDEAGRAVNSAILAVAVARELGADRAVLAQIAMAAMMHDVGRPRAMSLASGAAQQGRGNDLPMPGAMSLSEDQEDRLPGGTAAVLTALGRLNEPTIGRTVVAFEALWQRRKRFIGPVYRGTRPPTLQARLLWMARRYNDLVTPEPGLDPTPPHAAIGTLHEELSEPTDRTLLQLLAVALGIIPVGTIVQLSSGEMAEVIARPGDGPLDRPLVRLLAGTGKGGQPIEIDLAHARPGEPARHIARVMSTDFWGKGAAPKRATPGYDEDASPAPVAGPAAGPGASQLPAAGRPRASTVPPGAGGVGVPRPAVTAGAARPFVPRPVVRSTIPPRPGSVIPPAPSPPVARAVAPAPTDEAPPSSDDLPPSLGTSPSQVGSAMGRAMPGPGAGKRRPSPVRASLAAQALPIRAQPDATADDARTLLAESPLELELQDASGAPRAPAPQSFAGLEPPTAKGILETTPLPHVLVYMLDHQLSGTVVLYPPGQPESAIVFLNGIPAKVSLAAPGYRLGEFLTAAGALPADQLEQAVQAAREASQLFGEYLVESKAISRAALDEALERQLVQRVGLLTNLPPATEYAYFADRNFLGDWGGEDLVKAGALNAVLAAVRAWKDRVRVAGTLARLGAHQLVMHDRVDLEALALSPEESPVLDALITRQPTLAVLNGLNLAQPEVVASLVYALAVTRQFAFPGQVKAPMAPRLSFAPAPAMSLAPSSLGRPSAPSAVVPAAARPVLVQRRAPGASGIPRAAASGAGAGIAPRAPAASSPMTFSLAPSLGAPVAPRVSGAPSPQRTVSFTSSIPPSLGVGGAGGAGVAGGTSGGPAAPRAPVATGLPRAAAPSSIPASASAAGMTGTGGAADAEAAMGHFRTAETQLQRGDLNGALAAAERAVAADPDQAEYAALRAWAAALAKGTPQVALSIAQLDEILAEHPHSERALLYRGKLHKRANRPDLALADLERLLLLNPKHREATGEVRLLRTAAAGK